MFEPGDLVLIPVPFSDLISTKRRPVLLLTASDSQDELLALAPPRHARARPYSSRTTAE